MRLRPAERFALFAVGAAGGLLGVACHVQSGTTTYLDDPLPFVWESQLWFPLAVGLATATLGELRVRLGGLRPGSDPRIAAGAIASVLAIYALAAFLHERPELPGVVLVAALAIVVGASLGGGLPALACALLASIAGPAIEIAVVDAGLAEYASGADSLAGVATWLPALYLAFGFVAARLAELLVARRPTD